MTAPDSQRQTCKVCGRQDKFDFYVSDSIWASVIPEEYRNRVVCLSCFDDFATQKKISYAGQLSPHLYFAGDAGNIIWTIESSQDYLA